MASTSRCWQYVPESKSLTVSLSNQTLGQLFILFFCLKGVHKNGTSELQTPQLESDQPVADLNEVDQGVEVVGGQNEAVSRIVVSPSAQHEVATEGVLQRARQILIEDGVQVAVITTCRGQRCTINATGSKLRNVSWDLW